MTSMSLPSATATSSAAADVAEAFREARERTLGLVSSVTDDDLERVHSTLMSPLVWDLGHIAAFEDLWLVHRYGGRPLLREDLAEIYDAFETPRAERGDLEFLRPDAARDYLAEVRDAMLDVIDEQGSRRRLRPRDGAAPRAAAQRDDAPDAAAGAALATTSWPAACPRRTRRTRR